MSEDGICGKQILLRFRATKAIFKSKVIKGRYEQAGAQI